MRQPLRILILADGDDVLRLYKRVGCAARALGVELEIEEKQRGADVPRVFVNGSLLLEGLQRTEAIEARLAAWLASVTAGDDETDQDDRFDCL
jgi:hypothetical protein